MAKRDPISTVIRFLLAMREYPQDFDRDDAELVVEFCLGVSKPEAAKIVQVVFE